MRVGLWLPTFAPTTVSSADVSIGRLAARAEQLGFDSLWTLDHLLPTEMVHSASWYDPLMVLAHAAATTERIELGTASLVVGFRHPVWLAKQLATLAALAGPRVTLGASSGWFAKEYEVFGYSIDERGGRTDECLKAVRALLDQTAVTFSGRFWSFADVTIVPRPTWHVPILVGGGSRIADAGSEHDFAFLAGSVLRRICMNDGWLAPCSGDESLTFSDLKVVREAAKATAKHGLRCVQIQWTHIVDTDDREKALASQLPALRKVMGAQRQELELEKTYLTGSLSDIRSHIERLALAGFDDLVIGPVTSDPAQLELIAAVTRDSAGVSGHGAN